MCSKKAHIDFSAESRLERRGERGEDQLGAITPSYTRRTRGLKTFSHGPRVAKTISSRVGLWNSHPKDFKFYFSLTSSQEHPVQVSRFTDGETEAQSDTLPWPGSHGRAGASIPGFWILSPPFIHSYVLSLPIQIPWEAELPCCQFGDEFSVLLSILGFALQLTVK
jgi:hypothetical protein